MHLVEVVSCGVFDFEPLVLLGRLVCAVCFGPNGPHDVLPRATVLLKQLRSSYAQREAFILRFSVVCTCLIAFACV